MHLYIVHKENNKKSSLCLWSQAFKFMFFFRITFKNEEPYFKIPFNPKSYKEIFINLRIGFWVLQGSSSTLGVNSTFGEVRPSLGRKHGRRISAPKDDVSTTPGPSPPGSPPGTRPEQTARPAAPKPQAAVSRGHQPGSWPRQPNSGAGPASGRPGQAPADEVFFSSQLCLCPC
jgi:hypothetical protein